MFVELPVFFYKAPILRILEYYQYCQQNSLEILGVPCSQGPRQLIGHRPVKKAL